ncbi:metallopeptidase TldD-related protein [Geodermatophilus amargosae]|uniref:metallopeptidase TldD-related protein n=1 Tax=Geodermatophilus amargosae TaxID=1296565 RepID=UPI0034DF8A78
MRDLAATAEALLAGCRGDEEAEVYGLHRVVTRVETSTGGELRQVSRAETLGVGLRLVIDGAAGARTGYASTTDLGDDGLGTALTAARAAAVTASPDPADRLPEPRRLPSPGVPGLPTGTDVDAGVRTAVELARAGGSLDPRVRTVDLASWREECSEVSIVSTRGVRVRHGRRTVEIELAVVGEGADGSATGYAGRCDDADDVAALAAEAVAGAVALLGPRRELPPGLPVLLSPDVTATLLTALGRTLTGPALDGAGPFRGPLGTSLASEAVTLDDDGPSPLAAPAGPFDDEGQPRQVTRLLDRGRLVGALHTSATAPPGTPSTGSARRGSHRSLPGVGPTLLRLTPTVELPAAAAVLVHQLSGEGAGIRPVTGRVDVGLVACLLDDGVPAGRLPILPLSTTFGELWSRVVAVSENGRAVPGFPVVAPTVMIRPGLL